MKYAVCVYAICKNEEKFARRWYESMREADWVVALDTGSTDNTVSILRSLGARVYEREIRPWRFDAARNEAMRLIPDEADICVSADLDEVFEPGWRAALESAWRPGALRARFRYTWSFNEDGSEGTVLWLDKIHARRGYMWQYPVHEALAREDGREETDAEVVTPAGVRLNHYPDARKSRAQYMELLRLAVHERPLDARALHYLGREYMYAGEWPLCVETLSAQLALPGAKWKEERSAALRYIARAVYNMGDIPSAKRSLLCAIGEAPHLREPYVELAALLIDIGDWPGAAFMANEALKIPDRPDTYASEAFAWNGQTEALLKTALDSLANSPDGIAGYA